MPFLLPNQQRHSTEGIKVLATVCIYSIFGHLCQFPVMLQIYFRPAVQCNSTLALFCYLSSVCLFYFRFYYCLHICANKDSRWADDAHLPSVIPSIKVSTRATKYQLEVTRRAGPIGWSRQSKQLYRTSALDYG